MNLPFLPVSQAATPWWPESENFLAGAWTATWLTLTLGVALTLALVGWKRTAIAIAMLLAPLSGIAAAIASVAAWHDGQPRYVVEQLTVCGLAGVAFPMAGCILAQLVTHMFPAAAHLITSAYRSVRAWWNPERALQDETRRMRAADVV